MSRTKRHQPGARRRQDEQSTFQSELLGKPYDNAAESESINKLKKKIRDAERLLQSRKDLPADIEVAKQRELQSLNHDLQVAEKKKRRAKMIKRYHQVRFFERQEADRRLKQSKRAVENCKDPAQLGSLQKKAHIAQIDLNYTLFYPLLVPYVSLLHSIKAIEGADNDDLDAALEVRHKNEMWLRVEKATEAGNSALQALRNEELSANQAESSQSPEPEQGSTSKAQTKDPPAKESKKPKKKIQREKSRSTAEVEEGSDNEFFE